MALAAFQRALFDLVSDPAFCLDVKNDQALLQQRYDLTDKEQRRLYSIICQKGMAANCTLYRLNRVTPVYTSLPYTCKLLKDHITGVLHSFWRQRPRTNMQFRDEIAAFCKFLKSEIASGQLKIKYLEEILELETNINELKYGLTQEGGCNTRTILFGHQPTELLEQLVNEQPASMIREPVQGLFHLVITLEGEDIRMSGMAVTANDAHLN